MDLLEGETIVFQGHPSWRSVLGFYLAGLLLAAVVGGLAALASRIAEDEVRTGWVVAAVAVVLVLMLVAGLLKRIATQYTITNRRLHIRRGLLSRNTEETRIERVQNVNTSQSLVERMLGVGTVDFDVASDERQPLFRFTGVANPRGVLRALDEASQASGAEPSSL